MQASVMHLYLIGSAAINGVVAAHCAFRWCFIRRPRNILFGIFCAAISAWSLIYLGWQLSTSFLWAYRLCTLLLVPAGFIGPLYFHCVARACGGKERGLIAVGYALAGASTLATLSGAGLKTVAPMFDLPYWPRAGIGFVIFLATYGLFVPGVIVAFVASGRAHGYRRQALRIHGLVTLAGMLVGFSNMPGWFGVPFPPWSNALVTPYLLGTSFTFEAVLSGPTPVDGGHTGRSLTLLVLLALAGGLCLLSIATYSFLTPGPLPASAWLLFFVYHVGVVSACYSIMPRVADFEVARWRFLHLKKSPVREALTKLERELPTCALPQCGTTIANRLGAAIKADAIAVYLSTETAGLRLDGVLGLGPGILPDRLDPENPIVRQAADGEAVALKWLDLNASTRWAADWQTAIPVAADGAVVMLVLIRVRPKLLRAGVVRELQIAAFRIHHILYARRLSAKIATQESLLRLGYLAAGMAHEVRTPLTSIQTYIELAQRGQLRGEPAAQLYAEVKAGIDRIVGAIEAVSAYADNRGSERAPLALREIVEQTKAMCAADLRKHSILFHNNVAPDVTVSGNRRELMQVFANLVTNAIEAMSASGSGRIDVAAERLSSEQLVRVRVADSGPGLPPVIAARLGQPFLTTRTTRYEAGRRSGYGLGLSIILDRIVAHGGTLSYQAPAFIFTLPAAPIPQSNPGLVASLPPAS